MRILGKECPQTPEKTLGNECSQTLERFLGKKWSQTPVRVLCKKCSQTSTNSLSKPSLWVASNSSPVPVPSPEKWGGLASGKASGCKTLLPKPIDSSREEMGTQPIGQCRQGQSCNRMK
ncbi:hypothetical protein SK128_013736 [Halocaridina rubra]|uniref:Uncharacterized protein n=1 Tax=Halocaridina rubra TaxID=373956 RepID=A0AAN8ZZJ7_HALRR